MTRAAAVVLFATLAAVSAGFAVAAARQERTPEDNVTLCHATSSASNPYLQQTVDVSGVLDGHDKHPNDIIPPFDHAGGRYPGKNWDAEGQAIADNRCEPLPDVTPLVRCVEERTGGLLAHFGYRNDESGTVSVQAGAANGFSPPPENRGQPVLFQPGTTADAFTVPFSGTLTWRLAGRAVTASAQSVSCGASIRIDKALDPANDPGRFDLLLDGTVRATSVGQGGTTGTLSVTASAAGTVHTVAERAAAGTSLDDYSETIVCRSNGGSGPVVAEGSGPSLAVTVRTGDALACVVLNARVRPPRPGAADLRIVKTARPASVPVGQRVTWTVTVTNVGPDVATNVVVEDTLPDDASFVDGSLVVPPGMTCVGARCTLPSLAVGASVTARFTTTMTAVGRKTNVVTVDADQEDLRPADNAASAVVTVTDRVEEDVAPVLQCVERLADGSLRAHFGYRNRGNAAVRIPIGPDNAFTPTPEDRGQPRAFEPGLAVDVLQVGFAGTLVWRLGGGTATASASSERCAPTTGWIRIDKLLRPTDDPGRFDLEIDGLPAGTGTNVGHLGTTGDVAVSPGRHRVGEEAGRRTSLADYETTIVCRGGRGRGAALSAVRGPELVVDVAAGDEVVCTVVNTRRAAPVPPPELPIEPTPLPPPAPGTSDLAVQKSVDQRVSSRGDIATWTVVVRNNGPLTATGVTLTDEAAARATFVSLQTSQGTCGRTTCALGTLTPGAGVRIVARTRSLRTGSHLNTAVVRGREPDSVPMNNAASALLRVVSGFRPPFVRRCDSLSLDRRVASARDATSVRARVLNVFGRPLPGVAVRAEGAGRRTSGRTDARGLANVRIAPGAPGIVRFTVDAEALTAAGARRCVARVGLVGTGGLAPGVTG